MRCARAAADEPDGRHRSSAWRRRCCRCWQGRQKGQGLPTLRGWVQSMAVRAAFSRTGARVRRAQRRFRDWTGQSHRDLQLFARTEGGHGAASSLPASTRRTWPRWPPMPDLPTSRTWAARCGA